MKSVTIVRQKIDATFLAKDIADMPLPGYSSAGFVIRNAIGIKMIQGLCPTPYIVLLPDIQLGKGLFTEL